jgi:hypothetical protein
MSQPPGHPTLLRHPVPDGVPFPVQTSLNLDVEAYRIEQRADLWIVRVTETGEAVYYGPGPVDLFVSPTAF